MKQYKDIGFMWRKLPNGQFQIERVNYWSTSVSKQGFKGEGLNTFIKYLREVKGYE